MKPLVPVLALSLLLLKPVALLAGNCDTIIQVVSYTVYKTGRPGKSIIGMHKDGASLYLDVSFTWDTTKPELSYLPGYFLFYFEDSSCLKYPKDVPVKLIQLLKHDAGYCATQPWFEISSKTSIGCKDVINKFIAANLVKVSYVVKAANFKPQPGSRVKVSDYVYLKPEYEIEIPADIAYSFRQAFKCFTGYK